jgi:hypothetical protein
MAHFAEIDQNNIVQRVLVVDKEFIDSGALGNPQRWIQTSFNTHKGVHSEGGTPLRKNFASVGYRYDPIRDAFIAPKPYPSWAFDETTYTWVPPVPYPDGVGIGFFAWDEITQNWVRPSTLIN